MWILDVDYFEKYELFLIWDNMYLLLLWQLVDTHTGAHTSYLYYLYSPISIYFHLRF